MQSAPVKQTGDSLQNSADLVEASREPGQSKCQDLLRSGYLGDNEVKYSPAFGTARKN
jgi:hypothetical protein